MRIPVNHIPTNIIAAIKKGSIHKQVMRVYAIATAGIHPAAGKHIIVYKYWAMIVLKKK